MPCDVETLTIKVTKEHLRGIDRQARRRGFASRSEFIRYAITALVEEDPTPEELEDIVEGRHQIRERRTLTLAQVAKRLA